MKGEINIVSELVKIKHFLYVLKEFTRKYGPENDNWMDVQCKKTLLHAPPPH